MHRREKWRTGKSGQTANAEVRDRRDADILRQRTAGLSARACNGTLCTSTGARSSASLCAWSWASCQCSKPVFFRFFLGTPIVCPTCFVAWSSSLPGQGATRTARDAHRARRSGSSPTHGRGSCCALLPGGRSGRGRPRRAPHSARCCASHGAPS